MKLINKSILFLILLLGIFCNAEPVLPPPPEEGGCGTCGTGAQASPIDMYIYALAIVGFLLIVFYNKLKQRKVA